MVRPFALSVGTCGLVIVLATCGVDRITNPPLAALSVLPSRLLDSAAVGSLALRGDSIKLVNSGTGTLSWTAHRVLGSPWLTLSQTSGRAPAEIRVALEPAGLAPGVYRDTVIVSAENAEGSPTRIPVEFVVHPCTVTSIATDAHLTDSVSTTDCSAPHRPGSLARLYSLSANAGDSISIIMSSTALDGHVVLASSTAGTIPPLAEADRCDRGPARAACLGYQLLPTSGTFVIEATSSSSTPQTGIFTLSVTRPHPPNTPDLLMQLRADSVSEVPAGGGVQDAVVVLRGTVSDPDNDSLRLEVETQPVLVPFTNTPTASSLPVSSGGVAVARIADLGDSTSYHWQTRTVDQTGRASAWLPFHGDQTGADFRVAVAATRLVFTIQPTEDTAGAALAPAVQVVARDTTDHTTIAFAGAITVAIGANSGGATLSGTTTVAATGGVATFSDLSVNKAGSGYTLTASSPGLQSATSPPFTVEPGPARNLAIATGNDQTATVNSSVPTPPAVLVRDQFDNPVPGVLVMFAVTSGAGVVTPATAVTTGTNGIAALTSWTLGTTAGPDTLTATATGLAGVQFTATATAAAPSADQSRVEASPTQTIASAGASASTITVTVRDAFGNSVRGATVTLAASGTANTLAQQSDTTNASGQVTGTLSSTRAELKTISATVNGTVLVAQSATVTVSSAAAAGLAIDVGDNQTAAAGTAVAIPPSVLVTDAFGNPVTGVPVTFLVTAGGGTRTPTTPVATNASGIAMLTAWTLGTHIRTNTLAAVVEGLASSPVSFRATVPPPPGPVPDPTRLPVAAGQAPAESAYAALDVANQPAGFSYNDPVTGVKVWKVTSDVMPAANSGAGHDYGDGGNQVSYGWGPDNNTYTILVRPELAGTHLYYVVDFTRGVGFSNYRLLTVQPREDLSATFSSLPNQPHILYVCTGSELVRYNTATMQVENTGNFPLEVNCKTWLHQDHDDIWFTGLLDDNQTVLAWNSQTNQYLTHFEEWTNEPRLERDGRFLVLTGGAERPIRVWDLLNNAFGPTQTTGVDIFFSHLASLRSGWVAVNPNGSAPFAQDRYEVSGGQIVKTTILNQSAGAEVNNSGNWVQSDDELGGDLTKQWAVVSGIDEASWSSSLLWNRAVGLERADGSDQRLLLHHYDVNPLNTTGYFSTPWGHPSPDGKVVIFNSNMNGSGRYDLFVAEVPLR